MALFSKKIITKNYWKVILLLTICFFTYTSFEGELKAQGSNSGEFSDPDTSFNQNSEAENSQSNQNIGQLINQASNFLNRFSQNPEDFNEVAEVNNGSQTTADEAGELAKQKAFSALPPTDNGEAGRARTSVKLNLSATQEFIYNFLTGIGSYAVYMGGGLLEYSLSALVVNMGGFINEIGMGAAIDSLWTVMRDIFNLLFIFGLIYIGFVTILKADSSGTKKMLASIIAAALLINFSLYVSKIIVDFTNLAAYQIYGAIQIDGAYKWGSWEVKGVAGKFIETTDLESYPPGAAKAIQNLSDSGGGTFKVLGFGFIIMIFMLVSAFVFAAGAFLMLTRFIALVLLMIFSPAMFLGWVFPAFQSYSSQWWGHFLRYAFVAPAYLFMIYLSLTALNKMDFGDSSFGQASVSGSISTGLFGFFLYYLIVTGFVYASLLIAQKMGTAGASKVISIGNGIAKGVRGAVTGAGGFAAGFAGRNTLGRWADNADRGLEKRGWSSTSRRAFSAIAGTKFGGNYSRKDVREAKEKAKQKSARYNQTTQINAAVAAGSKGGASGDQVIAMERAVSGASSEQVVEMLGKAKPGTPEYAALVRSMSHSQFEAAMKAKPEELDDAAKKQIGEARSVSVQSEIANLAKTGETFVDVIGKANISQLETLGAGELVRYADGLSASQLDDMKKSKHFTDTEVKRISDERDRLLWRNFVSNPASVFTKPRSKEIARLQPRILKDPRAVPHLTGNVLKQILDNDTLTEGDRSDILSNIKAPGSAPQKTVTDFLKTPAGKNF